MSGKKLTKLALFAAIFALGVAMIVVTLTNGGTESSLGIFLGGALCAMAGFRVYLTLKHDL